MRQTDEQKKAALQQQIAALKMKVRRIEQREADAARRARNHRLIVGGAIVEEHVRTNSAGEFARAYGRLLAQRVEPKDRPALRRVAPRTVPDDEAAALPSDVTM